MCQNKLGKFYILKLFGLLYCFIIQCNVWKMRGSYYLGIILTIIKVWRDICRVSPHIHEDDLWPVWWRLQGLQCIREIIVPYLLDIYYIYYIYYIWTILEHNFSFLSCYRNISQIQWWYVIWVGAVRNVTCKCVTVTVIFWQLVKLHYLYLWQIYKWQSNLEPRKYHYHLTIVICYERFL